MRTLRILLLIAMPLPAAAQSIIDATAEVPPAVRDDARVAPRVTEGQACRLDLLACPSEDRNRLLLFLSAISGAKRPLILR